MFLVKQFPLFWGYIQFDSCKHVSQHQKIKRRKFLTILFNLRVLPSLRTATDLALPNVVNKFLLDNKGRRIFCGSVGQLTGLAAISYKTKRNLILLLTHIPQLFSLITVH